MTRNARFLEVILRSAGRGVAITRLQKLAYMADLLAWRTLGRPISEFRYARDRHGPHDGALYSARDELVDAGLANLSEGTTKDGYDFKLVTLSPVAGQGPHDLTPGELHIINHVIQRYLSMDLGELLNDVVYKTTPMTKVERRGEPLPMEAEKNKDSNELGGISLEQVLRSREEFARGEYVTLDQLKAELSEK